MQQSQQRPKAVFFQDGSGFVFPGAGGVGAGGAAAAAAGAGLMGMAPGATMSFGGPRAYATPGMAPDMRAMGLATGVGSAPFGGMDSLLRAGGPTMEAAPTAAGGGAGHLLPDYARYQENEIAELKRKVQQSVHDRNREVESLRAHEKDVESYAAQLRGALAEVAAERDNFRAMLQAEMRTRSDMEAQQAQQQHVWAMQQQLADGKRAEVLRDLDTALADNRAQRERAELLESALGKARGEREGLALQVQRLDGDLADAAARLAVARADGEALAADLRRCQDERDALLLARRRDEHARAAADAERQGMSAELAALGDEVRRLRADREDAARAKQASDREAAALSKELRDIRTECAQQAASLERASKRVCELEAAAHEAARLADDRTSQIALLTHERELLQRASGENEARFSKLLAQLSALTDAKRELDALGREHAALTAAHGDVRADLAAAQSKIAALQTERDKLQTERHALMQSAAETAKELSRLQLDHSVAGSELARLRDVERTARADAAAAAAERQQLEANLAHVTDNARAAAETAARTLHELNERASAERAAMTAQRAELETRLEAQRSSLDKALADVQRLKDDRKARAAEAQEMAARLRMERDSAVASLQLEMRDERSRLLDALGERAAECEYLRPLERECDDLRQKVAVLAAELQASNADGERSVAEHRSLMRRFEEAEEERARLVARRMDDLKEINRAKMLESALSEKTRALSEHGRLIGELQGRLAECNEERSTAESEVASLRARVQVLQTRNERLVMDSEVHESVLRALTADAVETGPLPAVSKSGREVAREREATREASTRADAARDVAREGVRGTSVPRPQDELRSYLASLDESIRNITGLYE